MTPALRCCLAALLLAAATPAATHAQATAPGSEPVPIPTPGSSLEPTALSGSACRARPRPAGQALHPEDEARLRNVVRGWMGGAHPEFIPNLGQFGGSTPEIAYTSTVAGVRLWFGESFFSYEFHRPSEAGPSALPHDPLRGRRPVTTGAIHRVVVDFPGSRKGALLEGRERLEEYSNYYSGPGLRGITRVPHYATLVYRGIFPEVDLKFESRDGNLKYSFIVHPGGRAEDIRVRYRGGEGLKLRPDGRLEVSGPFGKIIEQRPSSWQEVDGRHHPVPTSFRLEDGVLSFDVSEYDPRAPLVIDPVLGIEWGTYYGGAGKDEITEIALDQNGHVYVAGLSVGSSAGEIATPGTHKPGQSSGASAFVARFSTDGVRQWGTFYGGGGVMRALGLDADSSGNSYLVGTTSAASGIATGGAHDTTVDGPLDGYIAKFDSAGLLSWGTYFGGGGEEILEDVTVGSGRVFVAGLTSSASGIATPGAHQTALGGDLDGVIASFTPSGTLDWATYYGGTGTDSFERVLHSAGSLYLSGFASSTTAIATAGTYQPSRAGGTDAMLVRFDIGGSRIWGTYLGGTARDLGYGVAIDSLNRSVYLCGLTESTSGIATPGSHQEVYGGGSQDVFVSAFNLSGGLSWSTYFGGSDSEDCYAAATGSCGEVYVAGRTTSPSSIATPGQHQSSYSGAGWVGYISEFNHDGSQRLGTYYGGDGVVIEDLLYDGDGAIFVGGRAFPPADAATPGSHRSTYGGGSNDGVLARFSTAPYPCAVITPENGPISWWSDCDLKDRFANNDGTNLGPFPACPVGRKVGDQAIGFASQDEYISVSHDVSLDLGTGDFTIETWLKTSDDSGINPVVDKRDGVGRGYQLYAPAGEVCLRVGTTLTSSTDFCTSGFDVANGVWHHVAAVMDRGSSVTIYIDGNPAFTTGPPGILGNIESSVDMYIGASPAANATPSVYFTGLLDDLAMFRTALSLTRIREIYESGCRGKCPNFAPYNPPEFLQPVPTLSEWALILFGAALLALGSLVLLRRP